MFSMFRRRAKTNEHFADAAYASIVAAARQPWFYSDCGVPDTPLGRYELISLHMILFLRRTKDSEALASLAQDIVDIFFLEVDHSIRELGVGDPSVPKRMKKLARMFYGRAESYGSALDAGDTAALAAALSRNIKPTDPQSLAGAAIADYVVAAAARLAACGDADLLAAPPPFPVAQGAEEDAPAGA